jgi:hypothetical protein
MRFFLRDRKGPRSPALYLTDLADDIGLYGMTYEANQRMLDAVIRQTQAAGLFINVANTKYIVRGELVDTPGTITLDGVPIDRVEDFKYLAYVGSVGRDIDEPCKAASRASCVAALRGNEVAGNQGDGGPCCVLCG